jgi:hypothetical protein
MMESVVTSFSMGVTMLLSGAVTASDVDTLSMSAQIRFGYLSNEQGGDLQQDTLALGGQFGFLTPTVNGVSVDVGFYSTNALFGEDENRAFLNAQSNGYSILGESWIAVDAGATRVTVGRQVLDTPFADTDDIAMIPNLFEGVAVTNEHFQGTTITLMHLRKWASRDNRIPERFMNMNKGQGVSIIGVRHALNEYSSLQAWHYDVPGLAGMTYLEAAYGNDRSNLAIQATNQSDNTGDGSGQEGDAWGVMADYSSADFTFSTAYNSVSGVVGNGFGGGPYFTSSEDHTLDGVEDERATLLGLEYRGGAPFDVAVVRTRFAQSEDETDWIIRYSPSDRLNVDIVYHDMDDDGKMTKVFINYDF